MICLGRSDVDALGGEVFASLPPLRDEHALEAALGRVQQLVAFGEENLFVLASFYADSIVRSHPFVDGNKRMAWGMATMFLALNGLTIDTVDAGRIADVVVALAERLATREYFAGFLDAGSSVR